MRRALTIRLSILAAAVSAAACTAAGMAPATPDAAATTPPPPMILVSQDPNASAGPGIAGATTGPTATPAFGPGAGGSPLSPPPPTRPSARPTPARFEGAAFLLVHPGAWAVKSQTEAPPSLLLERAGATATFYVSVDATASTLAERKQTALKEAGPGKLTDTSYSLDEVRGYFISSNRDMADGKRYVAEYGFEYRDQVFVIQAIWDKRLIEADEIQKDVQGILRSFRWL